MQKINCSAILFILIVLVVCPSSAFGADPHRAIQKGHFILQQTDLSAKMVPLKGQWEFYWGELLGPKDFQSAAGKQRVPQYIEAPSIWSTAAYTGNDRLSNEGYGTYRLRLKVSDRDANQIFSLYLPAVASSFNIWIDGELAGGNGTVGIDRETMKPRSYSQVVSFQPSSNEIELIMQVSNFSQRKGGMWSPVMIGYEKVVMKHREMNIIIEVMTASCLLALSFYHISLYLFRAPTSLPLFLGIFCLFISLRTLLVGDILFMYIFPSFSWELSVKLEYLTFYLGLLIVFVFMAHLFPQEMHRGMMRIILSICTVFSLTTLLPAYIYTFFLPAFEVLLIVMCPYLVYVVTRAALRKREGSYVNFMSIIVLVLAIVNDVFFHKQWIQTIDLAPISAAIFLFIQSLIVAKKSSNAFQRAESLSHELMEVNASLEEKVVERTRDLQEKNSQLRHIEASRKTFFSSVAHEIGTPMQSIQGYIQLAQSQIKSSEIQHYLHIVIEKTKLINRLSKDLLDLAKMDEGQFEFTFEYTNVHFFFEHMNERLRYDIEKKEIHFLHTPPDPPEDSTSLFVLMDVIRMEQVLINLVQNAIKFTGPGGTIGISSSYVQCEADLDSGTLFIKVTDNGQGIETDFLPHIFDRFVKGKTNPTIKKGSGLGLSICSEIVKKHNGSISVESETGKGSTFIITLPARLMKEDTQFDKNNHDC